MPVRVADGPTAATNPRQPLHGFSLVELLVVMTIISILAALLLPVLGKAIASARSVACMANLKQISVAFTMYADENTAHYGSGVHNSGSGGPNLTWHGFLYPYLDINHPSDPNKFWWFAHEKVYYCPAKDTEPKALVWGQVSYGMSWFNGCVGSAHPCANPYNCEQKHYWKAMDNGPKTVLVGDSAGASYPNQVNIFRGGHPSIRHPGDRTNLILWDLHVASVCWKPRIMGWSSAAPRFDLSNHYMGNTSTEPGKWYENEYNP